MKRFALAVIVAVAPSSSAFTAPPSQPYVRVHGSLTTPAGASSTLGSSSLAATLSGCTTTGVIVRQGALAPGGGTLNPLAFFNPCSIDDSGRGAFYAQVVGSARNQGVFVSDGVTVTPIAVGCGGGGGSGVPGGGVGDPTPLGGTFSGFFAGTVFAPATNDVGDVVFIADVDGGSANRGLFFHRASTQQIEVVAAPGTPSPLGGVFSEVGPGGVNDDGVVVFLARQAGVANANAFRWQAGVVTKVAATGDPAPNGGTYTIVAGESFGFSDGTSIPTGPVPSINDAGQIAFRPLSNGPVSRGIVVVTNGVAAWRVRVNAPAPGGGTYFDFQAASLNERGDVAFFADFKPTPTTFSSGWFVVPPTGTGRRAMAFFDALDGGAQCFGLAFSRNPFTPLDDTGNLVVWTDAKLTSGAMQNRLVLCAADGTTATIAASGDASPLGGTYGTMDAWPSLNDVGQSSLAAGLAGAPGVTNAHFLVDHAVPWLDLGDGLAGTNGVPRLSGAGILATAAAGGLSLTSARPNAASFLFFAPTTVHVPLLDGTLVPAPTFTPLALPTDAVGAWSLSWASLPPVPACIDLYLQAWIADPLTPAGAAASNGLRGTTH
ncbi:MAG: hypothetical protein JNL94_02615 [Planctomycetes bacterium]|nr:hypothetical protein [Planctomycetota bacterium]